MFALILIVFKEEPQEKNTIEVLKIKLIIIYLVLF